MNLLCGCIPADASGSFFRFYGAMRGPSCVAPRCTEIKKRGEKDTANARESGASP